MVAPSNVIGAFSEEQAERLSGVSVSQLRRWDRQCFFQPSFAQLRGVPYGRIYSFRDLVSLRVLNDLRNLKKIPLRHLREVSQKLSHLGEDKWTATTLYVLGKRVVYHNPRSRQREDVVSGQGVLSIPLRVVIADTRRAVREMNNREGKFGKIERSRFVSQNEAVIAGTRIPVATVKEFAAAGYSPRQIIREFPDLTEADVAAAVEYDVAA